MRIKEKEALDADEMELEGSDRKLRRVTGLLLSYVCPQPLPLTHIRETLHLII